MGSLNQSSPAFTIKSPKQRRFVASFIQENGGMQRVWDEYQSNSQAAPRRPPAPKPKPPQRPPPPTIDVSGSSAPPPPPPPAPPLPLPNSEKSHHGGESNDENECSPDGNAYNNNVNSNQNPTPAISGLLSEIITGVQLKPVVKDEVSDHQIKPHSSQETNKLPCESESLADALRTAIAARYNALAGMLD